MDKIQNWAVKKLFPPEQLYQWQRVQRWQFPFNQSAGLYHLTHGNNQNKQTLGINVLPKVLSIHHKLISPLLFSHSLNLPQLSSNRETCHHLLEPTDLKDRTKTELVIICIWETVVVHQQNKKRRLYHCMYMCIIFLYTNIFKCVYT